MMYTYLIIGGGIAGVMAAETIREHDEHATIGIISDEPHVLYSRVLLPSYLKKRIPREKVFLRSVDDFVRKRIDLHLQKGAKYIDTERHEIILTSGERFGYDKLLIASGGTPAQWGREEDQRYIYRLQTLDDADRLFAALPRIRNPIVVGSSFISFEFLEIFSLHSIQPVLLVRGSHCFSRFVDAAGGALLKKNFEDNGVSVKCDEAIEKITDGGSVVTKRGETIPMDALAVGVGLSCNMEFCDGVGIERGERGITTDAFLETNQEGVFAAGDVAEFYDTLFGVRHTVGNWTNAILQGKRAGLNMIGERHVFNNVPSYSITNFGLQITALGLCSNELESIARIDEESKQYERFFLKNGIIVGAVLINRFGDKAHLTHLIENRISLAPHRQRLRDFGFDIKSIVS